VIREVAALGEDLKRGVRNVKEVVISTRRNSPKKLC